MVIEELCVGDWVFILGLGEAELKGVSTDDWGNDFVNACGEVYYQTVEDCKGIQLTPFVLEKIGFSKTKRVWSAAGQQGYELPDTGLKLETSNGLDWSPIGCPHIVVKYVHDLQHLMRLCKIEKEVKL